MRRRQGTERVKILREAWAGQGLKARLIRSSGWTAFGFGASQVIRLVTNLVLTRLLLPEAFGLSALLMVFVVGLTMLSDVGIGPSIQQNKRGDDPDFLDTAWTVQAIRGVLLWLLACAIAPLAAWFYGDPRLLAMLPVIALSLVVSGLTPTRVETANRHLALGRLTRLELLAQAANFFVFVVLAWIMASAWALVWGNVAGAVIRLFLLDRFLPGRKDKLRWERTALADLIGFGKWIFVSTICGFLLAQGDKAILGKYLSLDMLGIYNIGNMLGSVALALAAALIGRIMLPLHRECPPGASVQNFARLRRARFALTAAIMALQVPLALAGTWIVELLYDQRFAAAGGVVVAAALTNMPAIIGMTYRFAAMASGDTRRMSFVFVAQALTQTAFFLAGAQLFGLPGALAGIFLAGLATYPLVIRLARRYGAWDPLHDIVFAAAALITISLAFWLHRDALALLQGF